MVYAQIAQLTARLTAVCCTATRLAAVCCTATRPTAVSRRKKRAMLHCGKRCARSAPSAKRIAFGL